MPSLPPPDRKIVQKALSALPARINSAKEAEMGEMMGKLKEVCFAPFCLQEMSSGKEIWDWTDGAVVGKWDIETFRTVDG